jgi:hypothetical protein
MSFCCPGEVTDKLDVPSQKRVSEFGGMIEPRIVNLPSQKIEEKKVNDR